MTDREAAELQEIVHAAVALANRAHRILQARNASVADALAAAVSEPMPKDLIEVDDAAEIAHRPADTIRMWCRANPIDVPGGFGVKLRSRWTISSAPFHEFLRKP